MDTVFWLIGRGASIACNLSWTVPNDWLGLPRDEKVLKVKNAIRYEISQKSIDSTSYKNFLSILATSTTSNWNHRFITTNWDDLLEREISKLGLLIKPAWLADSHVYHINGTIEELPDNCNRSPFLLEDDPPQQRVNTVEANSALNHMIWGRLFIVVGMSFECQMDKFLLHVLQRVEDDLPIGESKWFIVNSNSEILDQALTRIATVLPRAIVAPVNTKFEEWVKNKMPELKAEGVFFF